MHNHIITHELQYGKPDRNQLSDFGLVSQKFESKSRTLLEKSENNIFSLVSTFPMLITIDIEPLLAASNASGMQHKTQSFTTVHQQKTVLLYYYVYMA